TKALDVLEYCRQEPALAEKIDPARPEIWAQLAYGYEVEMVRSSADFLMRRVPVGLSPGLGEQSVEKVSRTLGRYLGWSEDQVQNDVESYRSFARAFRMPEP